MQHEKSATQKQGNVKKVSNGNREIVHHEQSDTKK